MNSESKVGGGTTNSVTLLSTLKGGSDDGCGKGDGIKLGMGGNGKCVKLLLILLIDDELLASVESDWTSCCKYSAYSAIKNE